MCDMCGHGEVVPGSKLCPVCLEAMLRLAAAVRRIEEEGPGRERVAAMASLPEEDYNVMYFGVR